MLKVIVVVLSFIMLFIIFFMSVYNKIEFQNGAYHTTINSDLIQEWIHFMTAEHGLLYYIQDNHPEYIKKTPEYFRVFLDALTSANTNYDLKWFSTNHKEENKKLVRHSLSLCAYEFFHFIKNLERIGQDLKDESMYGVAEAMVTSALFYYPCCMYIHGEQFLYQGSFNNAYEISFYNTDRTRVYEHMCLRVARWNPGHNKGGKDWQRIYNQLVLNSKIFTKVMKNPFECEYLPQIYLSSIGSTQFIDIYKSINHNYNGDGIVSWYILPMYETFEDEQIINIYNHGLKKYIQALLRILFYAHENDVVVLDWKVHNMGYGPNLCGRNSFVLLDYDFQDINTELNSIMRTHAYSLDGFICDVNTPRKINAELDWYIALKDVYALLYALDVGGNDAKQIYNKYLDILHAKYTKFELIKRCKDVAEMHKTEPYIDLLNELICYNDEYPTFW